MAGVATDTGAHLPWSPEVHPQYMRHPRCILRSAPGQWHLVFWLGRADLFKERHIGRQLGDNRAVGANGNLLQQDRPIHPVERPRLLPLVIGVKANGGGLSNRDAVDHITVNRPVEIDIQGVEGKVAINIDRAGGSGGQGAGRCRHGVRNDRRNCTFHHQPRP